MILLSIISGLIGSSICYFLGLFGIDRINWINAGSTPTANTAVMVIYIVWNALPFKILILLAIIL